MAIRGFYISIIDIFDLIHIRRLKRVVQKMGLKYNKYKLIYTCHIKELVYGKR